MRGTIRVGRPLGKGDGVATAVVDDPEVVGAASGSVWRAEDAELVVDMVGMTKDVALMNENCEGMATDVVVAEDADSVIVAVVDTVPVPVTDPDVLVEEVWLSEAVGNVTVMVSLPVRVDVPLPVLVRLSETDWVPVDVDCEAVPVAEDWEAVSVRVDWEAVSVRVDWEALSVRVDCEAVSVRVDWEAVSVRVCETVPEAVTLSV